MELLNKAFLMGLYLFGVSLESLKKIEAILEDFIGVVRGFYLPLIKWKNFNGKNLFNSFKRQLWRMNIWLKS